MKRMKQDKPSKEERPWGFFEILSEVPGHKVKRITVHPGGRLSLQRHLRRHEHWVVVSGGGLVTRDGQEAFLKEGDALDIPVGAAHRVANPGRRPFVFIEVQRGDYLGEDDVIRLQDDYGRLTDPPPAPGRS